MRDEAEVNQEFVGGGEGGEQRLCRFAGKPEESADDVLHCATRQRSMIVLVDQHAPRIRRRLKANMR